MTKLQKFLIIGIIIQAFVLASLMNSVMRGQVVNANYWECLQVGINNDKRALKKHPDQPAFLEKVATDYWLLRNWNDALPLMEKARSWYMTRRQEGYTADYERLTLRLADLNTDKGDFERARDLYRELQENDLNADRSAPLSRDYNNIGLCNFLLARTKTAPDQRRALLLDAMANYCQAEQIMRLNNLQAQLSYCLQNQSEALFMLGQKSESEQLHNLAKNIKVSVPSPGKAG